MDGGAGDDRIDWYVGDSYSNLSGGEGGEDLLTIWGDAGNVTVEGSDVGLNITAQASVLATGFEGLRLFHFDTSGPQTVMVNNPLGIGYLEIATGSGNDTIEVRAADFTKGIAEVAIETGLGEDTVRLYGANQVGDLLEIEIETGADNDIVELHIQNALAGPTTVEVSGGDGKDTVRLFGSEAAEDFFITQVEDSPLSPDDEIEPGQYLPEFEQLADDLADAVPPQQVRDFGEIYMHTGKVLVNLDMDALDKTETLEIHAGNGGSSVQGRLDQFDDGVTLETLVINGGDLADWLDISQIATAAVPTTMMVNGRKSDDVLIGRGELNFLDGGADFDVCVAAGGPEDHANCESHGAVVTAEWDEKKSEATKFGTYIQGVTLMNEFTINFVGWTDAQVDEISQISVAIQSLPSEVDVNIQRVGPDSNLWKFTIDTGLLKAAEPGGVTDREITITAQIGGVPTEVFRGDLQVTRSLSTTVFARPVSTTNARVGEFVDIETLRFLENLGTRLEYQVKVDDLPFAALGAASPYASKLALIERNNSPDVPAAQRHFLFRSLDFTQGRRTKNHGNARVFRCEPLDFLWKTRAV